MSISNLRVLCVEGFASSKTRPDIMNGLERVLSKISGTALQAEAWIDGSFLTHKIDPNDSDIVIRITGRVEAAATQAQIDVLNWVLSDLKADYLCDSYLFIEYEKGHKLQYRGEWDRAYWLKQYGFSRGDDRKGIAVINLPY